MEIPKEVYEAHEKLSACSAKFLDFVKSNPGSLKRLNFSDLTTDVQMVTLQPWPTFIDQKLKKEFQEAGVKVCSLIKSVPQRFFANDPGQISQYYEMPVQMADTLLNGVDREHINNLLGRGDFILSSSGLKCLEYNLSANVAGWETDMWEALYLKNPIISDFLQQYEGKRKMNKEPVLAILFRHFIVKALDKFPGIGDVLNIAFVSPLRSDEDSSKSPFANLDKNIVQPHLMPAGKKLDLRLNVCSYNELKIVNNVVVYRGNQVHILVEQYGGVVPPDFVRAVKAGNVIIYNGSITGLMSNKLNLAVLSENQHSDIFTAGERETIKRYIPWTRKVAPGKTTFAGGPIDLEPFMYSHREQLVIKPSIGFGGKSVYIGKYIKEARWHQLVKAALKTGRWLVQEYVESFPYLYQVGKNGCAPHRAVWGFFIFGSNYAGGWVRVLPREGNVGVVNSHLGAEESVILEIDE